MISIVRFFGAPVIEPPGKQARMQSGGSTLLAQLAAHGGDELVHGLVGLDVHQVGHVHGADLADDAEVVAQQVDDHQVLGPVLLAGAQLLGQAHVLGRRPRRARQVPLIGFASTQRSRPTRRKRSGEELSTAASPKRRKAENGAGLTRRSVR